jgi:PKD repeat protein
MIEWGSGFNGNNTDSGIYRIDYVEGNRAPIARATANRTSGPAPLAVTFDGTASFDPDTGDAAGITYAWDFTSDGIIDATTPTASFTYQNAGNYTARLTVTDAGGRTGTTNIDIVAGNTAPTVKITTPLNGGFFEFGDYVRYTVTVTDPEDGTIDCDKVVVQPALGHDEHSHGYEQYRGCSGVVPIPGDAGHVGANIFGVLTASYTDGGSGAAGALTGVDGVVLHTNKKEAEFFDETGRTGSTTGGTAGVATQTTTDTDGGLNVTGVETGDWFGWDVMNLTNIDGITMRVASTTAGAAFEVRQGSPTGTAIASVAVPNTGGAQTWQNVTVPFTNPSLTSQPLYVVATTGGANVNWLSFNGRGITDNKPPVVSITGTPLRGEAPLPVQFASTVSDPENDTPLAYAWTFGDGTTATTANPTHTYATPGRYVATLVVTDARGAKTTQTTEINVTRAADTCFNGRSDDFVGAELDTTRWNRTVRLDQALTVADGTLNIPLTNTDIYQGTNTTPNIVLQDLPSGAFEVTTKVTVPAVRGYQQGGLIIYGDDNNYLKLVYSGRSTAAAGSKAANVIQFAKEVGGTASESNSTALGATFPDTVWLRMTSTDGNVVTPTYSTDGATWLPITTSSGTAAPRDLTGITAPKVGLLGLGSTAAGAADNIQAKFDYFTITPDDTATPCSSGNTCLDTFDGNALGNTWEVVRPTGNITVGGGNLTIPMAGTDLYQTTNTTGDLVLRDLPDGPFQLVTKVTAPIDRQYQQAGLIIYGDDDNYIKLVAQGRSSSPAVASNIIQLTKELNATATEANTAALGASFPSTVWLRLNSTDGTAITGEYSTDGETWTAMPRGFDLTGFTNPRVGLTAFANNAAAATISARFDSFELVSDSCGGEEPSCFVENFDGNALTAGWGLVRPSGNLVVSGGTVKIPLEATDLYQTTNTARDLVLRELPDGPFVATTKVSAPINRSYQSAGLLIYGDDDNYLKHVFQGRSDQPAAASNIIQTARETTGTAVETNTAGLGDTFPTTVWLRVSSTDGNTVLGSYSTDGETWTDMSGGYDIGDLTNPRIGLLAAANTAGGAGITASFDWFTLGGDADCEPGGGEPTDTTAPTTTLTIPAATGTAGWYTTRPSFTLAATDNAGGSGLGTTEYRIAGGAWTPYTTAVPVTGEGERLIEFRSTDKAGNVEATKSQTVKIDTVVPTVSGAVTGTTAKTLTLTATDATSGVARIEYQVGDATTWTAYTTALSYSTPGTYVVRYRSVDNAGNTSAVGTSTVVVDQPTPTDTTAPTTTITIAAPTGESDWYTTAPSFTLVGTDDAGGSGVASTEYRIGGGAWMPYTTPVTVTGEGDRVIEFRSTDVAGNVEAAKSRTVKVDTVVPTVTGAVSGEDVMSLTLTATDATSGVARIEYRIGDAADWTTYTAPVELDQPGTYVVSYRSVDNAGNTSAVGTSTVVVEEEPTAPSVALTVNPEEPDGRAGWYTSAVTVTLTGAGGEGDLSLEYRIGDGAWTAYTAPFQVAQDGTNRVQARATDGAGTVSEVVTSTFRTDATAPRLTVAGIAGGAKLNLAAVRTARITTTDATSGIATRVIRLDGKVVGSPTRLDAMLLRTGTHRLVVTVTDKAGNTTSRTITFRVVATYAGAKQLVNRLDQENKIGTPLGKQLKQQLNAAQKADKQGKVGQARQALNAFSNLAKGVRNAQARSALTDAARQLKAQL